MTREGSESYWKRYPVVFDQSTSFTAFLAASCERLPDKTALVYKHFHYSYKALFGAIAGAAQELRARVPARSRIALLLDNSDLYIIWYLAILAADLVAVPLNTKLTKREIEYMLSDSAAVLLLSEARFAEVLKDLTASAQHGALIELLTRDNQPSSLSWRELGTGIPTGADAAVYYTSGTTGRPKGVVHSHGSLIAGAIQGAPSWEYDDDQAVNLAVTPLFHIANHTVFLPTLHSGGTLVVGAFKSDEIFELIQDFEITHLFAVPSMLLMMLQKFSLDGRTLSRVRSVAFGAAPIPAHKLVDIQKIFPSARLVHGMGQTESCGTLVTLPSKFAYEKAGSVGINIAGTDIRIVDDKNVELPSDQVGELVARSASMMSRYLNNPEATSSTLEGGWLHTGDLGFRDAQGYVYLVDRKKDMIIRGGENIYSTEVEQVLMSHPAIAHAAVIGIPSELLGEEVLACIVKAENASELGLETIRNHCAGQLAKFKIPAQIRYFAELPQTATGKIQKNELKKVIAGKSP